MDPEDVMTRPTEREAVTILVEELNAAHGLRFEVRQRCPDGMQGGAWLLQEGSGRLAVLKHRPAGEGPDIRRLAGAVARIRVAGYPTPAWLASGASATGAHYWVQEHVRGRPATPLTASTTAPLIEVLERQAGLDPLPDQDWTGRVTALALSDEVDCPRDRVRRLGPAGDQVLAAYDRLLADAGRVRLPGHDMVHGDFNSCNLLLRAGGVAGVIDVQDLGSGSRVVDYACLLREAYVESYGDDVTRPIRRAGEAVAGWPALVLCVAAAAFFIVEFKRRHQPGTLTTVIARLHELAGELADPC
jgi:aminoglycoside phosphotransferase (APT) family kinase protein